MTRGASASSPPLPPREIAPRTRGGRLLAVNVVPAALPTVPPAPAAPPRTKWVALIGNPNTGKTTVFNALTGFKAKVANYPGVTVDKKSGPLKRVDGVEVLDLPGTYSLAARSPDEMVAVDVLLGRRADTPRPDVAVVVADASNLDRNLYLLSQVLETGLPVVLALNMMDVAKARGHRIQEIVLSRRLGVRVVPIVASRGEGIPTLVSAIRDAVAAGSPPRPLVSFPEAFEAEAAALADVFAKTPLGRLPDLEVRRVLLDVGGYAETRAVERGGPAVEVAVKGARERLAAGGAPVEGLEATLRYGAIADLVAGAVSVPQARETTWTDRLDAVLTHRVFGVFAFLGVMTLIFVSIYAWASPVMDFLDSGVFGALQEAVRSWGGLGGGAVESLVTDGVIAGVGSVLVFLPQILILFCFLSILEDCGYMARAAFLMDRLLRWCGLSGKSFIPMLSSFACAVPGVLATRTIENRRDRLATILVAPLMSCSARLPVYTLVIGAFVPATSLFGPVTYQVATFVGLYVLGIVVAVPVAFLLKRTVLRGETPPFLMELPPYKAPSVSGVLYRMFSQGREFIVRASTLILATSVVVWALSYFPRDASVAARLDGEVAAADARLASALATASTPEAKAEAARVAKAEKDDAQKRADGEWLRGSILGNVGRAVEPAVAPIGWDWKVGVAVIASFPAREVVVSTMGVLYDMGADEDADALTDRVRGATWEAGPKKGQPVFDLASGLALAVFFALCMQCVSTLAVMRRETASWRWPLFAFVYLTTLAYLGALATSSIVRALA